MWPFGGNSIAEVVETALGAKTERHDNGEFTARDDAGSRTYDSDGHVREETVRGVFGGTTTYDADGKVVNSQG